jgi:hypothetical protein
VSIKNEKQQLETSQSFALDRNEALKLSLDVSVTSLDYDSKSNLLMTLTASTFFSCWWL